MKKISKRILALMLAMIMVISMAACGKKGDEGSDDGEEELSHAEMSAKIYEEELGEFAEYYATAKEAENVSEKFALMAIAEAKLLESGVLLPMKAYGGNFAISRLAPHSEKNILWGTDNEKYYQAVVTTEPIKAEDRDTMKEKWEELKGTGTYLDWAKDYLTSNGYTLKDSYTEVYNEDPETWDVFNSYLSTVPEVLVNTYDGLLEYDVEGTLQPALAASLPEVSEDGLTYTFKIREGVKWVDSQGREIAEVKADDWVAGMQHLLDACAGTEYLVQGVIVNAAEYINGEVTDFSEVGVKALDDYTLQYTLEAPCTYFTTMFGYSVFAPLCRTYYADQCGGGFGAEYETKAETCTYGTSPDNIAYCGPFLVTSFTEKNSVVFEQNPTYWNKDAMNITKFVRSYNDGSEPTKSYNDMLAGTIDGCGLNSSSLEVAKSDGNFDKYGYIKEPDATTYTLYLNLNRGTWANFNDETVCVSEQTEEDAERTNAAFNNVHFRRALVFSVDRATYQAQSVGEDLKNISLRNSYTPWNLVSLEEDATVEINGEEQTFAAGTYYGEIVQAQLEADGSTIVAYNPEADNGNGSGDGYDGWYNAEEAAAELEIAIEELEKEGVEISKENPIQIDYPFDGTVESFTNQANALKQSIEKTLGGKVVVNLLATDYSGWLYSAYYPTYGYENNYDISDCSGWSPDYGDPSTFLDTFLDETGYCNKSIGLY